MTVIGAILDVSLVLLVLGVAIWTTATRGHFPAVIGYIVYGLLLALVWVRLAAVDVALTEAAIGSGVTGAVLIAAAARLRGATAPTAQDHPGPLLRHGARLLCALVAIGLAALVLSAPDAGPSLAAEAAAHLAALKIGNPVTAVLLVYRAIDTLLEKMVLLLALLGVWSLTPDRFWGGAAEPYEAAGSDAFSVLTFAARMLPPVGIVVGVYVLWAGADDPGGAFQGGAILAAMWIMIMMARLQPMPETAARWLRLSVVAGPALLLAVGLAGFVVADGFLTYPTGIEKPLIIVIEVVLTYSIAVILGLLAAGPANRAPRP